MKKKLFLLYIPILCLSISIGCGGGSSSGDSDNPGTGPGEITYPTTCSYTVTVDGTPVDVKWISQSRFDVPVSYVKFVYPGASCTVQVTVDGPTSGYTLSPASKNIGETVSDNTISFAANEPNYLMLQVPGKERLCILIDPAEVDPPQLGDADVVNIMDYAGVDNTGATEITSIIQGAIDDQEGKDRVLYFPAGTYFVNFLYLKSDMTVYLAEGATLKSAIKQAYLMSHPSNHELIEGTSRGFICMKGVTNAKLKGRGTIDGNGAYLRTFERKMFLVKIENSENCEVEGILSLDSCFWNTLIYKSDNILISNYKVINNRLDDAHNETDGVDFDNCTNSSLYNAFLYTGDDCMAVKSDEQPDTETETYPADYINVANISHEKIVCFSGSAACKVGTKTYGISMSNISFTDIDVITANRGLVIDAVDTAEITGTVFEDIRIENISGRLVDFNMDPAAIYWRTVGGKCSVKDTSVTNVSSAINANCRIIGNLYEVPGGGSRELFIDNTEFTNFTVGGNTILNINQGNFTINQYARNITFLP